VGLLVFVQFWYWYPLTHFLSLALSPTCIIGLNVDLNMPKIEFKSSARPSVFAYPPQLEEKKDKNKEKVETAVLSITAKQAKRKEVSEKKKEDGGQKMEVDEEKKDVKTKDEKTTEATDKSAKTAEQDKGKDKKDSSVAKNGAEKKDETEKTDEDKKKEGSTVSEPAFEMLSNPARVMKPQLKVMSMVAPCRYLPLKDISVGGIIVMRNSKPSDNEEIIELVAAGGPKGEEEAEPEPPEPFEWVDE
jgi:26S proteasome regulatory subunit N2